MGGKQITVRLLIDRASKPPAELPTEDGVAVTLERDRAELRGTGGLLRDLAAEYGADDVILVANANQAVIEPLPELVNELARDGADGALLTTDEGAPCGLMLLRCGALLAIKRIGFVDFKEQALPTLAKSFDVRAVEKPAGAIRPIRTLDGYLTALRSVHAPDVADAEDPFAEDWFKTFGIVEPGATVDPTAQVHDSVVLRGARVGEGAVLVRCVVGEGARIAPGAVIGDRLVSAGEGAGA
jgi:NDP-sugar pyrophosphorylase family protein